VNMALLELLRSRPDSFFWPEAIARSLGISPAAVLRDTKELEEFGFVIDREPHRGFRYGGPAERLCPDQIEWKLGTRTIGRRIAVWQRTTSTNNLAARAAKSQANDGLVVLAEHQTAGRGRRHRRWHAPPCTAVLGSVLLFPPAAARNVALLTSLAAVAVADVINEHCDLPARIKWPNDVRVNGLKVCGILVEDLAVRRGRVAAPTRGDDGPPRAAGADANTRTNSPNSLRATVIGIGVNVNLEPRDFPRELAAPATSLMALCGHRLDRSEIARSLIQRLDHYYQLAHAGNAAPIWTRWRESADLIDRPVRVERADGELFGWLKDICPHRTIVIEDASGRLVRMPTQDVLSIREWS